MRKQKTGGAASTRGVPAKSTEKGTEKNGVAELPHQQLKQSPTDNLVRSFVFSVPLWFKRKTIENLAFLAELGALAVT